MEKKNPYSTITKLSLSGAPFASKDGELFPFAAVMASWSYLNFKFLLQY
jgi:hypothetical protein